MLFKVWGHLYHAITQITVHLSYSGTFIFPGLKIKWILGVVAHVFNTSTWEMEVEKVVGQGQP